jgi:hypothetical protein
MKAKFNRDCELEIIESVEMDEVINTQEVFKTGTEIEFDLIDHPLKYNTSENDFVEDKSLWNIQFGNGSMAMAVSEEWLEITDPN